MDLGYFLLLITLKNVDCYNPKRHTQSSSTSNFKHLKSKTSDQVIPARYKISSKTNYDVPAIARGFPSEYFPEVEYPESIMDSSKPFYLSASPFPKDVKSLFNSYVAQGNSNAKTATDYSWIQNENQNEKSKEKISATSEKVAVNEGTVIEGNEINFNDKNINETLYKDITILDSGDDTHKIPYSDNDMNNLFTNWSSSTEFTDYQEVDYVVGFIIDLDEFMKNFTNLETPGHEGNNLKMHAFERECSEEFKLISSGMSPNNNESIIEFNGNSFLAEEHPERKWDPLFEVEDSDTNDALISLTLLLNEYITNTSSVEDMQRDFCNVGTSANVTNTSSKS